MNRDPLPPPAAAGGRAEPAGRPAAAADLAVVTAAVAAFFAFAVHFELSEKLVRWGSGYESLQLDELPLTLLVLCAGLAWFAFRRAAESRREIAERVRAEARVGELLAHNRELSQCLILAQENERRALARELHDEIGQRCTAIRAEASYLMHAPDGDAPAIAASAQRIARVSEGLNGLIRDMLRRLRPSALDTMGLEAALQELCESWEEQSGIACGFFPRGVPADLDDSTCIALYRLVQEALTNVARHAGADHVRIALGRDAGGRRLALSVEDNGRGLAGAESPRPGFGLIGMRERVAGLHGEIRFAGAAGGGLRIEVELPLASAA